MAFGNIKPAPQALYIAFLFCFYVIVEAEKVTDAESDKLSFEIADKIQKEMQYPGQIKVTVIRELRSVNIAR